MLQLSGITKKFGSKTVLDNVNFSIDQGEVVGLVGPNGSGKTTLLNILMGMIKPTSGSFEIYDNIKIGMSVSRKGFFNDMTVKHNLLLYSKLSNANESVVLKTMNEFSIDFGDVRFGKLSAGMKQRVSLLLPFVSHNDLIFLDEPSNHLDIDSILHLRLAILKLKETGVSFLITSHIFSDLEKICNRILFLKNGKLIKDSTIDQLIQHYGDLENAYINILKC